MEKCPNKFGKIKSISIILFNTKNIYIYIYLFLKRKVQLIENIKKTKQTLTKAKQFVIFCKAGKFLIFF
jgi:hypothetical protein